MATSTMRLPWSIPGAYARRIGTWHPTKTGWRWNPIWEWTPMSWRFSEAVARTKASNSKPRQPTNRLGTAPMPIDFTAVPAGQRFNFGSFSGFGSTAVFWTNTTQGSVNHDVSYFRYRLHTNSTNQHRECLWRFGPVC